jgi:hypothetical protein
MHISCRDTCDEGLQDMCKQVFIVLSSEIANKRKETGSICPYEVSLVQKLIPAHSVACRNLSVHSGTVDV